MIYKPIIKNDKFLGGDLKLTPIELLTIESALREYVKNNEVHRLDRIKAQLMIEEMRLIDNEYKSS